MAHIPVLLKETVELLDPKAGESFVDCTLGDGGHAIEMIRKIGKNGKFLGIDLDESAIRKAESGIKNQELRVKELIIVRDNFANLKSILDKKNFGPVDGILMDLGLRSEQIEESGRGFSFLRDEPLDMRFGSNQNIPNAAEILNACTKEELIDIFRKFGEERFSEDVAKDIVLARKKGRLTTSHELVEIVLSVYRRKLHSKKDIPWIGGIHPATRVFQALRIEVNHELENLEKVLPNAVDSLTPGGRIAVISFHSLEDRIVKHFFRSRKDLKILTKKPITPSGEEVQDNPRSRSAKLRAAIKIH